MKNLHKCQHMIQASLMMGLVIAWVNTCGCGHHRALMLYLDIANLIILHVHTDSLSCGEHVTGWEQDLGVRRV